MKQWEPLDVPSEPSVRFCRRRPEQRDLFFFCWKGIVCLLVDSHAHIDTSRFSADREAVIAAAVAGGVTRMIDPGCDLPSSQMALALAKAHPGVVYAAVGVHPH